MKANPKTLVFGLAEPVVFVLMFVLAAGTFNYWQAWVLLAVFALSTWIPSIYLLRTNPVALRRRMRAGPTAEARMAQKAVMGGLWFSLAALFMVSALDHRFGWSAVPTAISLVGDVLVAVGLSVAMQVVIQNSHAAATVRVESGQTLISTGLYGQVRHPMYACHVITLVGIPLALGSYWGLTIVIAILAVLALRIRDEEKLLSEDLPGYREYTQKVRYRLVPYIW